MNGTESRIGCDFGLVNEQKDSVSKRGMFLDSESILADDWEIEEKKVEITRSQFFAAVDRALEIHQSDGTFNPMSVRLAQELGLE